ncbi:Uncharacterised protein [Pseudomonas fluorescens]|uniref:Transmembrane protein n=1 Tax=Pseudomonas fluorescens TaxID=294 RepID=A0A379IJW8_PSEFL|nr:hypothetical protein [Pseudomonas fluorescens]AIG03263.1 hypothetical protein HZ99_14215 [Pseudomonas fluorescens]SUD33698.1 Uncharacterised protein [Pseudomonas fluorescens]
MSSIDTWPLWVAIVVSGSPGLLALVSMVFSLYLTHCHLDALKEALRNSRYIYAWGPSLGKRGVIWSLLEMAKICGMVVWPKAYIRMGDVNPADLENFPPYLKRLLIIDVTLVIASCIGMAVVALLVKFR